MSVIDKFKDLVGIEEEYDEDDFDDTAAATMWCRCRTVP